MKKLFQRNNLKKNKTKNNQADKFQSNHQQFMSKFKKNNTQNSSASSNSASYAEKRDLALDSERLSGSTNASIDYYSPPDTIVSEAISTNTDFNISTWYSLNGRIGRVQLLAFGVIWGLIITFIYALGMIVISNLGSLSLDIISLVLPLLTLPALLYSYIILPRRRLHDIGKSGWWLLLLFIPLANILVIYYLYFVSGDKGVNKFGLPPLPYSKVEFWLAMSIPIFIIISIIVAITIPTWLEDTLNVEGGVIESSEKNPIISSEEDNNIDFESDPATNIDTTDIIFASEAEANTNPNSNIDTQSSETQGYLVSNDNLDSALQTDKVGNSPQGQVATVDTAGNSELVLPNDESEIIEDDASVAEVEISFEEFQNYAETKIYRDTANKKIRENAPLR